MALAVPASMTPAVAVAVAVGAATAAVVAYTSFRRYWTGLPAAWGFPPGPMSDPTSVPLLSDALGTLSDTRAFELAASRRYGDFHTHYFLGVNVATSTAAGVARVAALEAAGAVRGEFFAAWLPVFGAQQLFALTGRRHAAVRAAVATPLTADGGRLRPLLPLLAARIGAELDGWVRAGTADSDGMDVVPPLRVLTVALLTGVLFGRQ